jgi:ornithine decarboxylase
MLGAYGAAMKTDFNGFGATLQIVVEDAPMQSMYDGRRVLPEKDNVVNLR